jgi:type II secretory pathway component PulK
MRKLISKLSSKIVFFRYFKKTIFKNQSGIALLMVLTAIAGLTLAMLELKFSSLINYKLAVSHKNQLQAYYLAKSAENFSKIIIKFDKQAQKTKQDLRDDVGNINIEPIYRMFPLSTELLRGLFSGGLNALSGEGGSSGEENTSEDNSSNNNSSSEGELEAGINAFDKEAAKQFLDFEGDFSSVILEEQNKFDLNQVFRVVTTSPQYDQRKRLLYSILRLPRFEKIFEDRNIEPDQLTHALSDWVDENDTVNEFDNVQRGVESSLYDEVEYPVKNSKYLTDSEIRMVSFIDDEIYDELRLFITPYNTTDKINVCLAEEELVQAVIYHYTNFAGCTNGVSFEDEDEMIRLVEELLASCPDPKEMAKTLNTALGLEAVVPQAPKSSRGRNRNNRNQTPVVPGCSFQLEDLLTETNDVFTIESIGTVGETTVTIKTVLNTSDKNPNKWTNLYYKVY